MKSNPLGKTDLAEKSGSYGACVQTIYIYIYIYIVRDLREDFIVYRLMTVCARSGVTMALCD